MSKPKQIINYNSFDEHSIKVIKAIGVHKLLEGDYLIYKTQTINQGRINIGEVFGPGKLSILPSLFVFDSPEFVISLDPLITSPIRSVRKLKNGYKVTTANSVYKLTRVHTAGDVANQFNEDLKDLLK